jgi:UDP-glucose 4-epimerase
MRSYCAILTDRAHPSAEIENYLLSTSKLSTLYYADWVWITKRVSVYGDDYPTPDGTAVRDSRS